MNIPVSDELQNVQGHLPHSFRSLSPCQRRHRPRPSHCRAGPGGPRDRRSVRDSGLDHGPTSLLSFPLQNSELGGGGSGGPIRNKRYISLRVKLLKRQFGLPRDPIQ